MRKLVLTRRRFLAGLCLTAPAFRLAPARAGDTPRQRTVRFGVCADVHKDIMHDADERLSAFINQMKRRDVDFIIQLGDFCRPYPRNDAFMAIWRSFTGPGYHVLGNHDTDGGFTREQTVAYYQMPGKYYTFDAGDFRFIVLDGNDKTEPPQQGYARYIGVEQQQWLQQQLAATDKPVIVFSHQSLEDEGGVANNAAIRTLLEDAHRAAGQRKVVACFSGHHHIDYRRRINGIDCVQINSMSYFWMGGDYQRVRYSEAIDKDYPWIKYTAPYRDPLFAVVTLEPNGNISIEGTQSTWVGPSPWDLGYPETRKTQIVPAISTRRMEAGG